MQVISFPGRFKSDITSGVVVIGVFDGMHIGHKALLERAVLKARQLKCKCTAITFSPHPARTPLICSLKTRLKGIDEIGVDYCLVIPFTEKFSRMSGREFIKDIIVKRLNPHYLFVGSNFTFGRSASGNFRLLKRLAGDFGFHLKELKMLKVNRRTVSSTAIRSLIKKGKLFEASKLLGRDFTIEGKVISVKKLGRHIGFPTANIDYNHEVIPPDGVYAAEIIIRGRTHKAVCSITKNPTIRKRNKSSVEVFIFNFSRNIYRALVEVRPIKFLRKDRKFHTIRHLSSQIARDIEAAEKILNSVSGL